MAKRLFFSSLGFTASAAGSAVGTGNYMGITGGAAQQLVDILEILVSGQATASNLGGFTFTRQSTLGTTTASALAAPSSDGGLNPNITALSSGPASVYTAFNTSQPTPSALTTDAHLNLAMNSFGGILRWNAAPFQQYNIVGNAVTTGAGILYNSSSYFGATTNANAHIMYEPY